MLAYNVTVITNATSTRSLAHIHRLLASIPESETNLRGWKPMVCLDKRPSIKNPLVLELQDKHMPAATCDWFGDLVVILRLQRLREDDLVLVNDSSRQLVNEVFAPVGDLLMSLDKDQPDLLLAPAPCLLHDNAFLIFPSDFRRKWGLSIFSEIISLNITTAKCSRLRLRPILCSPGTHDPSTCSTRSVNFRLSHLSQGQRLSEPSNSLATYARMCHQDA